MVTRIESARGCGYRKPGGKYLVGGGFSTPCGKLPIPLHECPCCGGGIRFSRGWKWIKHELVKDQPCSIKGCQGCVPFDGSIEDMGLMWVGEKYYTPESFQKEAHNVGVSKRISALPKNFKVGETWVLLAHKKAIENERPGIFTAFKPTAIEYIVDENDEQYKLDRLEKQGFTLVKVIPDVEAQMEIS